MFNGAGIANKFLKAALIKPCCGSRSAIQPRVMESGGRNQAIHNEKSTKRCPGMRTRLSSQATKKAANMPINVLAESRKLNFNALKVCGVLKAWRHPSSPHLNPLANGASLKLFRIRKPRGTRVIDETVNTSAIPA